MYRYSTTTTTAHYTAETSSIYVGLDQAPISLPQHDSLIDSEIATPPLHRY